MKENRYANEKRLNLAVFKPNYAKYGVALHILETMKLSPIVIVWWRFGMVNHQA